MELAKKSRRKCDACLWTSEKSFQLIELFESHKDLWKVFNRLYSNR